MRNRRTEFVENTLNQMLKGPSGKLPHISAEDRERFINNFEGLTEEIAALVPPNIVGGYSSALAAVVCKCAIKYGKDKAMKLLEILRTNVFQGHNDPARRLWLYMINSVGQTPQEMYQKSVTAARAFCEERTLTELRPALTDVFEWDSDYTGPKKPREWWENGKVAPDYKSGAFRIFKRQLADNEWQYVISRKNEIISIHGDKIEVNKRGTTRPNASRRGLVEKEITEPKLSYTPFEVAEFTGYTEYTIRDACNHGRIQATKVESKSLGNKMKWEISYEELLKIKQYGLPKPTAEQRKRQKLTQYAT